MPIRSEGIPYRLDRISAFWLCFLIVSCDRAAEPTPGATPVASTDSVGGTGKAETTGNRNSPCPRTGRWAICSLEKRLEQAGFVLHETEGNPPRRSGFSVQPVVYTLGRARLEVFIYPDEAALNREVAGMDTTLAAARGQTNDWEIPPRFVRSGNLAAVFLTRNELQAERLTLAITAGAPQPDS
jgi:hypothetical protein